MILKSYIYNIFPNNQLKTILRQLNFKIKFDNSQKFYKVAFVFNEACVEKSAFFVVFEKQATIF
jgi:hypothetical protein